MDSLYRIPHEYEYDGVVYNKELVKPENIETIHQFKTTSRDVILASYPRSGRTWTSEIIGALLCDKHGEESRNDFQKNNGFALEFTFGDKDVHTAQTKYGETRAMRTHLYAKHINNIVEDNKAKIVLLLRNPKDAIVSYYHFYQINGHTGLFSGTFHEFFKLFKAKRLWFGDWLEFYEGYWGMRHRPNVLVLTYEDMVQDLPANVKKLSEFLGKSLTSDEIHALCQQFYFEQFQRSYKLRAAVNIKESASNRFVRRGKVGGWKDVMSKEQSDYIDTIYSDKIREIGLPVRYTL